MRIASVNQDPGISPERPKGAAVHLYEVRAAFRRLGVEVIAIDSSHPDRVCAALEASSVEGPLDMVYERYSLAGGVASRFARSAGIPHVLEVNAPLRDEALRYRPDSPAHGEEHAGREQFRRAALVVAVSEEVGRFSRAQGAPAERVRVIANGVDPERFQPLPPDDRARRRRELGVQDGFVVGFHGRLRPWHNLPLLAEACADLLRQGIEARLLAVGTGDFDAGLSEHLGPGDWRHVPWLERDEIGAVVACFDVLPLSYDPAAVTYFSPLKLYEAMAAGVVPVVPRLGDLPDQVAHGRSGLVVEPGDPSALSAAMADLARSPARRAALARGAIERARAHTWDDIVAEVVEHALGVRP